MNCAKDSMNLWKNNLDGEVKEEEAKRQLLLALKKVQGFDRLAEDLAHRNSESTCILLLKEVVSVCLPVHRYHTGTPFTSASRN